MICRTILCQWTFPTPTLSLQRSYAANLECFPDLSTNLSKPHSGQNPPTVLIAWRCQCRVFKHPFGSRADRLLNMLQMLNRTTKNQRYQTMSNNGFSIGIFWAKQIRKYGFHCIVLGNYHQDWGPLLNTETIWSPTFSPDLCPRLIRRHPLLPLRYLSCISIRWLFSIAAVLVEKQPTRLWVASRFGAATFSDLTEAWRLQKGSNRWLRKIESKAKLMKWWFVSDNYWWSILIGISIPSWTMRQICAIFFASGDPVLYPEIVVLEASNMFQHFFRQWSPAGDWSDRSKFSLPVLGGSSVAGSLGNGSNGADHGWSISTLSSLCFTSSTWYWWPAWRV